MKQQFMIGSEDTFRTYIFESNRRAVPQSASITIYRPSGERLVGAAPMDVAADGLLSFELGQADNATAGLNYRASIVYEYASRTHYATLFYDVVAFRLLKVITDDDITGELPQLKDRGWTVRGQAEGGSADAIVDGGLKRYGENYFTGGLAYSPTKDEAREVKAFDHSSGTVTTEPFSGPFEAGERYILTRSYSREIQRAFEKLEDRLARLGRRPELVLDPYDLREVHIYMSVAEACKGMAGEQGLWWEFWKEYERKAEEAFGSLVFKYDRSGDGLISGDEGGERLDAPRTGRR